MDLQTIKRINSRENSLIKLVYGLQTSAKSRRDSRLFVLEGLRICGDACENGIKFDKLIISDSGYAKYADRVDLLNSNAEETVIVSDGIFKKISETVSPQGIMALAEKPYRRDEIKPGGRYLALENIQDPANIGAAARTAEALGISGLIISSDCCEVFSPKSLRASMGTLLRIPVFLTGDFIGDIKKFGLITYGCVVDVDAADIRSISFSDGCAVLIGNEGSGLTDKTKESCDFIVTIPMSGRVESLNAAAAASIAMWEMMR